MTNKTSSALSFLIGAAAGAILGILFAPDKGSNTRDKLSYLLDKYRQELQEIINNLIAEEIPDSLAKEKGKKVITEARQKAEKLLEDVDDLIGQIKGDSN